MRNYCRFGILAVMNNCQITKQRKLITTRKTSFKHNNNYDKLQSSVFGLELPPRSALSMPQPESWLTTQWPMAMSANWRVKDVHWNYGAIYNLRRKNSSMLQCVRSAVNTPCIIQATQEPMHFNSFCPNWSCIHSHREPSQAEIKHADYVKLTEHHFKQGTVLLSFILFLSSNDSKQRHVCETSAPFWKGCQLPGSCRHMTRS